MGYFADVQCLIMLRCCARVGSVGAHVGDLGIRQGQSSSGGGRTLDGTTIAILLGALQGAQIIAAPCKALQHTWIYVVLCKGAL